MSITRTPVLSASPDRSADALSTEDWEKRIGDEFRATRIAAGLDQAMLAEAADLSIGAVRSLERGTGSTLRTVVRIARVLGREDWLNGLTPAITVSPIDMVRRSITPRSRVYRPRPEH